MMVCAWLMVSCSPESILSPHPQDPDNDEHTGYPEAEKLGVNINKQYINLDWEECEIVLCDTLNGIYRFRTNKNVNIEPGSVFQIWNDDDCYIIVAEEKAERNGNEYTVKGDLGDLCDIFSDCELHFATQNDVSTRSQSNTIYPVAEGFVTVDGKRQWKMLTRSKLPKLDVLDISKSDCDVIFLSKNGSVSDDKGQSADFSIIGKIDEFYVGMQVGIGIDLKFDAADIKEFKNELYKRVRSKNLVMDFCANATMSSVFKMSIDANAKAKVEQDVKVLRPIMPRKSFLFMVGEVPVVLSLSADLCSQIEASCESDLRIGTGYKLEGEFKAGAIYEQNSNKVTPYTNQGFESDYTPLSIKGSGNWQSKVHLFPQLNLCFYHTLSPYIQVKPYLKSDFAYKSQTTIGVDSKTDFYGQSIELMAGIDARAGIKVYLPWNHKKYGQLKTDDINIAEWHLYKSPFDIKRTDENLVTYGNENQLEFKIFDMDYVKGKDIPSPFHPLLTLQSYKSPKTLGIYDVDSNGEQVYWKPESQDDILYARVYDGYGNIACEHKVKPINPNCCPNDNHPHFIDLGLPSGTLWSCCNVGADKPTQYGEYYAWAMTKTQSRYGDKNYPFYKYSDSRYWEDDRFYYEDKVTYTVPAHDIQGTKYDAATTNLGSNYVTPNYNQLIELRDHTRSQKIIYNGTACSIVVGDNDNCILLPFGGVEVSWGNIGKNGSGCYMCSETLVPQGGTYTYEQLGRIRPKVYQLSARGKISVNTLEFPTNGFSVRPVKK